MCLFKVEEGDGRVSQCQGGDMVKAGLRVMRLLTLKMEGGHKPRNVGSSKRQGNGFSLRVSKKEHSPADTLVLAR